jgi:flagellar hook-associated protein 2
MGTVGLNFGSATSGQGFNVTETVTSIVTNLQKVEQPWKDQLGSLQAQDTAFSNLGTLLSTLSSDLSQLTDFTGVLAQKTGSSSDTNVLQLASASSTAVAGSHSVAVTALAQTSSGYLTPVGSASEALSGSIDITVGAGIKHTITLGPSNGTLAGLAAAINQAGVGVNASVLTDSNGSRLSLVSGRSGAGGSLAVNSSIVDTGNGNAALAFKNVIPGTDAKLTVDGVDLTSASNTVSNLIPGLTFQLLSVSHNGSDGNPIAAQVIIGNDNSGVESAVAAVVKDYNALVSAINQQQGNDSRGKAEPLFGSPTLSLLQQQLMSALHAPNPAGTLQSISSSGITLTGSITLQVGSSQQKTISVPASDDSLQGLADAINTAHLGVTASVITQNGQSTLAFYTAIAGTTLNVNSNIVAQSTDNGGQATSDTLGYSNSSDIPSLSCLGITVSPSADGSLTLDASALDVAMNSDFSSVLGFFQGANSWGQGFAQILNNAGSTSSTGTLKLALNSNAAIEKGLNKSISNQDERIDAQKKKLTDELNKANQILQSLPSQLQGFDQLYSAISGYNTKS